MADLIDPQLRHDAEDSHHKMEMRVSRLIKEMFKERGLTFVWPLGKVMPEIYWQTEERSSVYVSARKNHLDCFLDLSFYADLGRLYLSIDVADRNEAVERELALESIAINEALMAAQQADWHRSWMRPYSNTLRSIEQPTIGPRDMGSPYDRGTPIR